MTDHDVEATVRDALDGLGVRFEALPCDPDFADTAAFCERYGVAPENSANTIVVAGKTDPRRYVACVVLATTRLGGVTPLALPDGLAVWVDERVMGRPSVVLGGGSRSMKIRVSPDVFRVLPTATIVPGLAT